VSKPFDGGKNIMDEKERRQKEVIKKRGNPLKVSRRAFLKGMGTSAIVATITTTSLPSPSNAETVLPPGVKEAVIQLNVNAKAYRLKVKSHSTLLDVLRRELGLTGTKMACNHGNCGACTVIVDGRAVYACSLLAIEMEGKKILTIEGLADGEKLHPIQQAFSENGAYQCGFCTSGQIMSSKALLDKNPKPSREQVRAALAGNLCRCSAYAKIIEAVLDVADKA
jgi:aerobic-type carbon monoxide dehydrogenase small subunit (CoxS/CutS family)